MLISNAVPAGCVQGGLGIIQARALGLDGHSEVASGMPIAHTLHSLYAHIQMCMELANQLEQQTAKITKIDEVLNKAC